MCHNSGLFSFKKNNLLLISVSHYMMASGCIKTGLHSTHVDLESNATLNKMAADASGLGQPFALDNSTYNNSVVQRMMMDALHSLDFNGVTAECFYTTCTSSLHNTVALICTFMI